MSVDVPAESSGSWTVPFRVGDSAFSISVDRADSVEVIETRAAQYFHIDNTAPMLRAAFRLTDTREARICTRIEPVGAGVSWPSVVT